MKQLFQRLWRGIFALRFVILTLLVFYAVDTALAHWAPVERSTYFVRNDYEKSVMSHGNRTEYEKVIYGNSTLISSYIEEQSAAGFVNFGQDYGTVCDLYEMLTEGHLTVTDELVVNLNYFVLMDTLETNPSYPWHRRVLVPYVYFQRDRLSPVVSAIASNMMYGRPILDLPIYGDLRKSVYHGVQTDAELAEKIQTHSDLFWGQGLDAYEKNLAALGKVADWCAEQNVRLRVFWGPWNNDVEVPENVRAVTEAANAVLEQRGVEPADMTGLLERKYFYDIGHLNYEYGAVHFTEVLDQWLLS